MGGANASNQSQNQSSISDSNSFGISNSMALGQSVNNAQSASNTFVDPVQNAFRQQMFSGAMGTANPMQAQRMGMQTANQVMPGLRSDFNALGAMTDPVANGASQKAALSQGLGHLFANELNPAIEGNAVAAGGFGGGRHGVAQGVAMGEMANAFTQGSADIDAAAQARAMQAAQMRPQLAASMFDLRQGGLNAGLQQSSLLSQIFGPATVLSRSSGTSSGTSRNTAISNQRNTSSSQSRSSGSANARKAGFNIFGIG